ncbi:protein GRAVITROPIC IN THE LIGHT 1-like [Musa acuminata AAA Group]|uniref:protein GRAVITROPIC IN THE LIGHT 1-like n=1 Tax=Musa acuminata AAA Group TaxID=214697 RepID=UPI0031E3A1F2
MLQKFALAFKTKTIEFFAEEEEEEEEEEAEAVDLATDPGREVVITGQRVVVLKPDPAPRTDPQTLAAAALAAVSSFQAAYLHLQTAHSPFLPDALRSADRAAVSHLRRLSVLRRSYLFPGDNPPFPLSSHLEAQVQENQSLLRGFETVVDRLQSDIDRKDAEAAALEMALADLDAVGARLADRLERACMPPEEKVEALLTVGVFDSVLRDTCRLTHRFARILVDLMKMAGWDLGAAANCIFPDVNYAKPGHCRYAILSYICLGIFEGFDSYDLCDDASRVELDDIDVTIRRNDSLQQFVEHSALDPIELMRDFPSCDFANFCQKKYAKLIHPGVESSLLRNLATAESSLGSLRQTSPLYEPFVSMASSVWMLHKLAWAYDPVVEIFQVARGTQFSMVFMENIVRKVDKMRIDHRRASRPKVGFTVVPGFHVGKTVIQSKVYVDGSNQAS